ncbi:MAG TPA: hypothetical protein VJ183_03335 [Chloroflexia bacterium]|nr:hypothetical protein [Chloroflexia bacterium]
MKDMKVIIVTGTLMAALAFGLVTVAGGLSRVSAQTPTAGTAQATVTPGANTPVKGDPGFGPGMGGHRGGGPGGFGKGGPGGPGGHHGDGRGGFEFATSAGASQAITNATTVINLVKADLAYAMGKMDTAAIEGYLKTADSLLASAQSAFAASQFGKAGGTAEAARSVADVAYSVMAQALGADKLPSYSQRPMHRMHPDAAQQSVTVTQAQASHVLVRTYEELVVQATLLKNAGSVAEASNLLTSAQNVYKQAYSDYGAGKYNEAVASAKLAGQLSHVVGELIRAANAPANADTPVTVPSPNF